MSDLFTDDDVEAAATALYDRNRGGGGDWDTYDHEEEWKDDFRAEARASLTTVAPGLVARATEALRAEVERLRGAASDIERLTDTYTVEGTEIVLNRMHDLRRERDEARARLAAVEALRLRWNNDPGYRITKANAGHQLRAALSSADPATEATS